MTSKDRHLLVELLIRIKTYDVDWVGHVNNIVYVRWLEDLRLQLLDTYLPLEPLRGQGVAPIIVTTNIHYRKGIALSDHEVLARMWVSDLGRATVYLEAEFLVGGEIRCSAVQRGAFIDHAKMKPIRIPQGLIDAYQDGPRHQVPE